MSPSESHFGCFSSEEVGCDVILEGSTGQAYLVDMDHKPFQDIMVSVAPVLGDGSFIKQVLVWNIVGQDSQRGSKNNDNNNNNNYNNHNSNNNDNNNNNNYNNTKNNNNNDNNNNNNNNTKNNNSIKYLQWDQLQQTEP